MYNKKIFFILGIIFVLSAHMTSYANNRTRTIVFNCQKELNRDSISNRCNQLFNTPNEIVYLKKMYSYALKKDSVAMQGFILSNMIKNYYNRAVRDSVRYCFNKLEKIALENKLYREYFDSFNLLCAINLYDQKYDEAIEDANKLYLHAKELNNTDGLIASYENSGLIYMETFRSVEAIKAFNEGLALLKKCNKRRYGYEFQLTTYIIESYLKLRDYKGAKDGIDSVKKILNAWKSKSKGLQYDRCAWLIDCYYVVLYVGLNEPKNAAKHLETSKQYVDRVDDACALYYQLIKKYSEAIKHIDKVLSIFIYQPALHLKGKILLESGNYKDAAFAYDHALGELDSSYSESFSKQINQLRTIHEVDKLEIKNKELEIGSRTLKLKIVISLAVILLAVSVVSFVYIIRIRKIRNKLRISDKMLKEDKRRLLDSEKELIAEKDKVEKSLKYKDIFLANMNHEVRTPLNAIVGFSSLLTDLYKDGSSQEYANIIKYNTDLLLKLINDTLDASSLQTGLLSFDYEQVDINSTCSSLIEEMKHNLKDGVILHFIPDVEGEFYLRTDAIRLSQLLSNLLLNSIKFTEKGDIYLRYKIDYVCNQVIFSVEDTGKGIPEEMQKIIFESFQKLDVFVQGLGLGLTLVKLISIKLGGGVAVDSSYNNGTRIIFIHPIN